VAPVAFSLEHPDPAALQHLWTDLVRRADLTFFISWQWIGSWVAEAGPPDAVLVGRADGEVVCLGLLRRGTEWRHGFVRSRTLYLHQTGCQDEDIIYTEYNGFLTDRRFGSLLIPAIDWLRRNGGIDEIDLGGIVAADHAALEQAGHATLVTAHKSTAFVDLKRIRDTGADYLAEVSSNTRYQIRRAIKAYEERGALSLMAARNVSEALAFFDAMGVLHERGWQRRGSAGGAWRYPFLVRFHKSVIERSFAAGGIDMVRIACGNDDVGYIYCLNQGGWIGSYLSGFAYEDDNKIKPGLVCHYLYIEHRLKTGGDVLDFLAGDHRYKTSLGVPGTDMLWVKVQQRRPLLMLERELRRLKQRLEQRRAARQPKGQAPA